uniref:Uncharacterized protein n=1 Tax=Aegilops tauschii TaxID=37682 RepID=M8BVA3_AEGTA
MASTIVSVDKPHYTHMQATTMTVVCMQSTGKCTYDIGLPITTNIILGVVIWNSSSEEMSLYRQWSFLVPMVESGQQQGTMSVSCSILGILRLAIKLKAGRCTCKSLIKFTHMPSGPLVLTLLEPYICGVFSCKHFAGTIKVYYMNLPLVLNVWEDAKIRVLSIELYVQWEPAIVGVMQAEKVAKTRHSKYRGEFGILEICLYRLATRNWDPGGNGSHESTRRWLAALLPHPIQVVSPVFLNRATCARLMDCHENPEVFMEVESEPLLGGKQCFAGAVHPTYPLDRIGFMGCLYMGLAQRIKPWSKNYKGHRSAARGGIEHNRTELLLLPRLAPPSWPDESLPMYPLLLFYP